MQSVEASKGTLDHRSPAEIFAAWDKAKRYAYIDALPEKKLRALKYSWDFFARPKQRTPPGDWAYWLIKSGRGFGKTRTGAEWIREKVDAHQFDRRQPKFGLCGRTSGDVREFMIEGESGLLSVFPPHQLPIYEPSKRRVTFYTGAYATLFSGDEPRQLKGANNYYFWADELAWWKYAQQCWDDICFGLRKGKRPQCVITTTPRPTRIIRELIKDVDTIVTSGSTFENATNLAGPALATLKKRYEGTRLGRQELYGDILDGHPGALWNLTMFEAEGFRIEPHEVPALEKIVVGLDPSATTEGNAAGIVACGRCEDGFGYVLDDHTLQGSPNAWATAAIDLLLEREGDAIIAEVNQGGEMVTTIISGINDDVYVETVHAARGKRTRAEPIAAKYEQGLVKHVGTFPELEDSLVNWVPGMESPDAMDAMVWAFTDLLLKPEVWIK